MVYNFQNVGIRLEQPIKLLYVQFVEFMTSMYFALTILSTVGYGDYFPISNVEMLTALVVMLGGVAFFSYIMGNLLEIFKNYESKMGIVDRKGDLDRWIISL